MTLLHTPRTDESAPSAPTRAVAPLAPVDLSRWPGLAPVKPAPVRAAAARLLLHRVARQTGIRVLLPDGTGFGPDYGPVLEVRRPEQFLARLARGGKIGFGEAYMTGDWDAPDLVAVLEPMARDLPRLVPPTLQTVRRLYDAHHPTDEDNDTDGARRNIARHYDLSNEMFALFLDKSMTYSAALFDPAALATESLEEAQARKIDRLLDVTGVGAGTRVLEIGTGWGELALRAAGRGATVVTVTLSREQAAVARQRVREAGFDAAVDIRVQDYREVEGRYDAVLSVEMIEAVGERWWPTYFCTLDARLATGGRVGLQAIVMPHDRLLASRTSWTWIHKYIFPGGLLPSVHAIERVLGEHTSLHVADRLDFGPSYAETLKRWRERFTARAAQRRALGFDETFGRMWTFYLAYCEAGFRAGYIDVAQFVLARQEDA